MIPNVGLLEVLLTDQLPIVRKDYHLWVVERVVGTQVAFSIMFRHSLKKYLTVSEN